MCTCVTTPHHGPGVVSGGDDVAAACGGVGDQVRGGGVVVDAGGQDIKSGGLRVDGGEEAGSMSMGDVHTETVGVLLGCLAGRSG